MKRRIEKSEFMKFGDPRAAGGAVYAIRGADREARVQFWHQLILDNIDQPADTTASEWHEAARLVAVRKVDEYETEMRSRGVPDTIIRLFAAERKKDKKKIASRLVITGDDFAELITNYDQLGFRYEKKVLEFIPDHLEPTEEERDAFRDGGGDDESQKNAQKFRRKIERTFEERKYVVAHLFTKGEEWHCFYFSFSDIRGGENNHWKCGPHVHYISHDWHGWTPERVWAELENRRTAISNSLHIRFRDGGV